MCIFYVKTISENLEMYKPNLGNFNISIIIYYILWFDPQKY